MQNKVSVFSGPYRSKETVETIKKLKPAITQTAPTVDDRPDKLAQMISEIFSEIINGNDLSKIKVLNSCGITILQYITNLQVTISTKIP